MAQTIKIKRSATSGNKLTGSNSVAGEIGMNTADKALYIQTGSANGDVVTVAHESTLKIDEVNNRVGIGTTSPVDTFEISKQLSAVSTVDFPLVVSSRDDGNSIDQLGGEGVGIKFKIANNASTTPGGSFVGAGIAAIRENSSDSTSTTSLAFYTSQNDETLDRFMTLRSSGNVGIGTASPNAPLHVKSTGNGEIEVERASGALINIQAQSAAGYVGTDSNHLFGLKANGTVRLKIATSGAISFNDAFTFPTAIGSAGQVLKVPTSGTTLYWADEAATSAQISITDADGDTKIQVEESADEDKIRFDTAGSQRMVIDSGGNFGFGVDTPSNYFHVKKNSAGIIARIEGASGRYLYTGTDALGHYLEQVGTSSTDRVLRIQNSNGSGQYTQLLLDGHNRKIYTNGGVNVGIGTSSPSTELEVHGTTTLKSQLDFLSPDGTDTISASMLNTDTLSFTGDSGQLFSITDSSTGTIFSVNDISGVPSIEVEDDGTIRLAETFGNVGIGLETPTKKLEVSGDFAVTTSTSSNAAYIRNSGTGTALVVNQQGTGDILKVDDNSTTKFIVKDGGRVGIGTTSPASNFHVKTSVDNSVSQGIIVERSLNSDRGYINYTGGAFQFRSTVGDPIVFGETDAEHMRILPDGNVGISTTTPYSGARMQVCANDTSPSLNSTAIADCTLILSNSDDDYGTVFATNGTGKGYIQQRRMATATYYDLSLQTYGGNVGIGTDSASAKLDVQGNTNLGSDYIGNQYTTTLSGFSVSDGTNFYGSYGTLLLNSNQNYTSSSRPYMITNALGANKFAIISGTDATTDPTIGTSGNITSGSARLVIDNAGNVGIGTISPAQKLDVQDGFIRVQSPDVGGIAPPVLTIGQINNAYQAGITSSIHLSMKAANSSGNFYWYPNSNNPIAILRQNGDFTLGSTNADNYVNTGSYFKPDTSGKFLAVTGSAHGGFLMLESSTVTDNDQVGGVFFTASAGQSDAHRQVAGIDAIVDAHSTNTALNGGDLRFFTKNVGSGLADPRMTIRSSGQVGIGTVDPNRKLHLSGSGATVAAKIEATDGSQASVDIKNSEGEFRIISDGGELSIYDQTDTAERLRIDTLGRVGIGTNNPLYTLDIQTTTGTGLNVTDDDGWATIRVDGGGGTDNVLELTNYGNTTSGSIIRTTGGGMLRFAAANTEAMRINANGNIAIGGSFSAANGKLCITESTANTASTFHTDGTSWLRVVPNLGAGGYNNLSVSGDIGLIFSVDNDATSDSSTQGLFIGPHTNSSGNGLKIQENGNIGIGTNSPSHKLHVVGDIGVNDNNKIKLGGSGDLELYHNATNSYIINNTGHTYLRSDQDNKDVIIEARLGTGNLGTYFIADSSDQAVKLYHGGSQKFATISNGIRVSSNNYGRIQISDNDSTGLHAYLDKSGLNLNITSQSDTGHGGIALRRYNGSTTLTSFYVDEIGDSKFYRDNGSTVGAIFDASTGRFGIGVLAPTDRLHIYENANRVTYKAQNNTHSAKFEAYGSATAITTDASNGLFLRISDVNKVHLDTTGNFGIGKDDPQAKFQVEEYGIETTTTTTSAATQTTIDTFAAGTFRSARYSIQVTNTTDSSYHMTEILLIHNGTNANITEYGTIFTGTAAEATFDADINSGNVRLRATPASADSMTFKVVRHCITV